jgi:sigma-E factor negative regulatory protein RseA
MTQPEIDPSSARRILSALADGDATEHEAARAFQAWREDADARATWHSYQLIGDVLRSDDLAAEPAADAAFLVALRARLAAEPVVLAPLAHPRAHDAAPAAAARARGRWQAPAAMAAGFLVVVVGFKLVRPFAQPDGATALAAAASTALVSAASTAQAGGAVLAAAVRTPAQADADADQLAPYLAAHRQSTMSGPIQMPGGDIRSVSLVQSAP